MKETTNLMQQSYINTMFDYVGKDYWSGVYERINMLTNNVYAAEHCMFDEVFSGKLRGVYTNPINAFEPVTDYGDAEYVQELNAEAINISCLQAAVKGAVLRENVNEVERHLVVLKNKMDYLLNKYPRIFASYGVWGSMYYNFVGILCKVRDDFYNAKANHIRGLIYECIYLARCVDLDNVCTLSNWANNNMGNLQNYNLLVEEDERVKDWTVVLNYRDLGGIFVDYLITVIGKIAFSRIGAVAYLTYVNNMLQIHYGIKEYGVLFNNIISVSLSKIEPEYTPLNSDEIDMLKDTLNYIKKVIGNTDSIEAIVDRFIKGDCIEFKKNTLL